MCADMSFLASHWLLFVRRACVCEVLVIQLLASAVQRGTAERAYRSIANLF
jgi:hypothetical protein